MFRPLFATFGRKDFFFFLSLSPPLSTRQSFLCKWSRRCKNQIHFGRLFTFQVITALGSTIPSLVDGQKKWAACQVDVSMTPSPQRWCVFQLIQWRVGWTLGLNETIAAFAVSAEWLMGMHSFYIWQRIMWPDDWDFVMVPTETWKQQRAWLFSSFLARIRKWWILILDFSQTQQATELWSTTSPLFWVFGRPPGGCPFHAW